MYMSSWTPLRHAFQRRRFSNLMELYELNYQVLSRMAPDLRDLGTDTVSQVPEKPALHLRMMERHSFTTDVRLTHYFSDCPVEGQSPDLPIRIYHDTQQAELNLNESFDLPRLVGEGAPTNELERRWMANLFLERWLVFCLKQGYRFHSAARHSVNKELDFAL